VAFWAAIRQSPETLFHRGFRDILSSPFAGRGSPNGCLMTEQGTTGIGFAVIQQGSVLCKCL